MLVLHISIRTRAFWCCLLVQVKPGHSGARSFSSAPAKKLATRRSSGSSSFRNTLVQLGQEVCKSPEQFKAWSQNLGHEKTLTTFLNYGEVACQRQGEIMRDLSEPQQPAQWDAELIAEAVFKKLRDSHSE